MARRTRRRRDAASAATARAPTQCADARSRSRVGALRRRAALAVSLTLAFIGGSVVLTAITVANGWLLDQRYAIIPTMGCIFIGVGVTVSAISSNTATSVEPLSSS